MPGRSLLALLITLAAHGCSSSSSSTPDAPPAVATVMAVTCPATPDATIMSSDSNLSSYMPGSVSISVGQIVKFTMSSSHNVAPSLTATTDSGLNVGFGATACLKFTKPGTFGFFCTVHSFTGTVTVQ
jgi:plastocyanin